MYNFLFLDQQDSSIQFINIQDRLKAGMYQCAIYCVGGKLEDAMLSAPAQLNIEVPHVNENIEYNRKFIFSTLVISV